MKSKEEIERLAFLEYPRNKRIRLIWINAYSQCQEDMAKELEMHILVNEHDWSRNPQAQLKDFINSLNKRLI
jgi:hypothetical protein